MVGLIICLSAGLLFGYGVGKGSAIIPDYDDGRENGYEDWFDPRSNVWTNVTGRHHDNMKHNSNLSSQLLHEAWDFERQYRNYMKHFHQSKRNLNYLKTRPKEGGGTSNVKINLAGNKSLVINKYAKYPYDPHLTHRPEYEAFLLKENEFAVTDLSLRRQPSNPSISTISSATAVNSIKSILDQSDLVTRAITHAVPKYLKSGAFVIEYHTPRNMTPNNIITTSKLRHTTGNFYGIDNNATSAATSAVFYIEATSIGKHVNKALEDHKTLIHLVKPSMTTLGFIDLVTNLTVPSSIFPFSNWNSTTFSTSKSNAVTTSLTTKPITSNIKEEVVLKSFSIESVKKKSINNVTHTILTAKNLAFSVSPLPTTTTTTTITNTTTDATTTKKVTLIMPKPDSFREKIVYWGLLLTNNSQSLASLSRIAPAIQVALKRQQVQSLLRLPVQQKKHSPPNKDPNATIIETASQQPYREKGGAEISEIPETLKVIVKQGDTRCSHIYGLTEAMRLVLNENVGVLFGPVCDLAAVKFARLTGRLFNVPMISAGTLTHDFGRNKSLPDSEFKLLTRVGPNFNSMAKAVFHVLNNFGWNKLTILYQRESHPEVMEKYCHYASSGILNELIEWNTKVDTRGRGTSDSSNPEHVAKRSEDKFVYKQPRDLNLLQGRTNLSEILKDTLGDEYTIVILCASQSTVRKILLTAYDLNMIQSGEYVFFNIELFNKPDRKKPIWEVATDTAENNAKAKIAYEALFTLTMRMPDNEEYRKFSDQVKEISKRVYGFDYGTENVNAFVSAFHDAVILYALALNETLQAGFNYTDGVEITRRMWNRTFTGITGNVSIDANGDRYTDYSLWDLNPDTGRFQVVLNYNGKENVLVPVPNRTIHWAGGRTEPPLDQPKCGYDGSLCRKKGIPNYAIIITFLGCLVIMLSILSFFIYRRYRLEAELGAMKWRIDWNDLMFQSVLQPKDNIKFRSKWSLTRLSLDNDRDIDAFSSDTAMSENIIEEFDQDNHSEIIQANHSNYVSLAPKSSLCSKPTVKYYGISTPYAPPCTVLNKTKTSYARLKKRSSQSIKRKKLLSRLESEFSDRSGSIASRFPRLSNLTDHNHHNATWSSKHHSSNHNKKHSSENHWYGGDFGFKKDSYVGTVRIAYYKSVPVILKPVVNKKKIEISRPLLLEIKQRKDLQNDYVTRFVGACLDNVNPRHNCLIMEYCQKGSLRDILENNKLQLDSMFRYSLMHDLTKGMSFLHNSEIRSHGNLKSTNCLVDSRFVLKITDFGLHLLRPNYDAYYRGTSEYYERKLWTAPELLRLSEQAPCGTQKADVYSFAIIMQEIVLRKGTFYTGPDTKYSAKDIVQKVKAGFNLMTPVHYFRPTLIGADGEEEVIKLIEKCWSEDPNDRMDFNAIRLIIRKVNRANESDNILDNLLSRMEHYANNLENLVEERTADYLEQKRKAEEVLYQLLPKSVATQLILGESVTAESFDSVTIYFSDIVGFTSISASSTPMQVVDLLNDLYTCFDSTIGNFDVYKVETIGDAYMVVSGLPKRINSNEHAKEISSMALALQKAAGSFTIRHRPFEKLVLRIGIHSGPCVAGVVGLKMPRYCLFGDTVNTASRMESTGKPNMIHISSFTKDLIEPLNTFNVELRGEVDVKGKGKLTTYWLHGYLDKCHHTPPINATTNNSVEDKSRNVMSEPISSKYTSCKEVALKRDIDQPSSYYNNRSDLVMTEPHMVSVLGQPRVSHSLKSASSSPISTKGKEDQSPIERLRKVSAKLDQLSQGPTNDSDDNNGNNNSNNKDNNRKSMYATPPSSPLAMKTFEETNTATNTTSSPLTAHSSLGGEDDEDGDVEGLDFERRDSIKPLQQPTRHHAMRKNQLIKHAYSERAPHHTKQLEKIYGPISDLPSEYQAIKFLPVVGSQHHDTVVAALKGNAEEVKGARAVTTLFKNKAKDLIGSTMSLISLPAHLNSFKSKSRNPAGYDDRFNKFNSTSANEESEDGTEEPNKASLAAGGMRKSHTYSHSLKSHSSLFLLDDEARTRKYLLKPKAANTTTTKTSDRYSGQGTTANHVLKNYICHDKRAASIHADIKLNEIKQPTASL